jgi:SAM-dependent methyltransferase
VVAVDGSRVALERLREESRRRGVEGLVDARLADLESRPRGFEVRLGTYDLICDFYFLERTLFEEIRAGTRPGALFVAAMHVHDPSRPSPGNPAFSLRPGELEALVRSWGWEVLRATESPARDAGHERLTAELVARRPAPGGVDR